MRILITGAGGMIGRKVAERLLRDGHLGGAPVELTLHDVVAPEVAGATCLGGDVSAPGAVEALLDARPEVIVHLAAVVSGEAEADLPKGLRVNLDATRRLLDGAAALHARVVLASTQAVFGAPLPGVVPDDLAPQPLTSYGAQKLASELHLSDLSRRGLIDGVALRLPTICVRPGAPNRAASGFFSGIVREPLVGLPAVLPVPRDLVHTMASPRAAVGFVLHAAAMDTGPLGPRRAVTLPGVGVSVGEEIEALRRVAGDRAVALIREEPDPLVLAIVTTWAQRFEARRAREVGFAADADFDAILRAHIEDEHGGAVPDAGVRGDASPRSF